MKKIINRTEIVFVYMVLTAPEPVIVRIKSVSSINAQFKKKTARYDINWAPAPIIDHDKSGFLSLVFIR